jgi:hypothetical protein
MTAADPAHRAALLAQLGDAARRLDVAEQLEESARAQRLAIEQRITDLWAEIEALGATVTA